MCLSGVCMCVCLGGGESGQWCLVAIRLRMRTPISAVRDDHQLHQRTPLTDKGLSILFSFHGNPF